MSGVDTAQALHARGRPSTFHKGEQAAGSALAPCAQAVLPVGWFAVKGYHQSTHHTAGRTCRPIRGEITRTHLCVHARLVVCGVHAHRLLAHGALVGVTGRLVVVWEGDDAGTHAQDHGGVDLAVCVGHAVDPLQDTRGKEDAGQRECRRTMQAGGQGKQAISRTNKEKEKAGSTRTADCQGIRVASSPRLTQAPVLVKHWRLLRPLL